MIVELTQRGTHLFSNEELTKIVQEIVIPELDDRHSLVVAGGVTSGGVQAALVFRKKTIYGEWKLEAAFEHDWQTNENQVAGRIIFKL